MYHQATLADFADLCRFFRGKNQEKYLRESLSANRQI